MIFQCDNEPTLIERILNGFEAILETIFNFFFENSKFLFVSVHDHPIKQMYIQF